MNELDRLEPELGLPSLTLNMDVRWLATVTAKEVEPVGANPGNRRHVCLRTVRLRTRGIIQARSYPILRVLTLPDPACSP